MRPPKTPNVVRSVARSSGRSRNLERRFVETAGLRVFGFGWFGPYPLSILQGATHIVPLVEGEEMTFDLTRILLRLGTPGGSSTTMHIEVSAGGGAFSGSPIGGVTLTAGTYEGEDTSGLGQVTSGDLIRMFWDTVGDGARDYSVEVEGTEAA